MASKAEAEKVCLECPLCLDNFKDATILNCGHTFCKGCLENHGDQRNDLDRITCPVCRKRTKLGPDRVAGLIPNFTVRGVEEKINVNASGQNVIYCTLHSTVYKDIFCVDCEIFICLSCYLDTHKDHKIIKKEEMVRKLREKKDTLVTKSTTSKTRIEKYLTNATQKDTEIHRHLNTLEKNVKDTFAQKVTVLQENEERLLKMINDIRKQSDEQSKRVMTHHRQLINNIEISISQLTDNVSESFDLNNLQAYHLQCREIENSLEQTIDIEPMVNLKQAVKSTRFCPADEKLLALGHIEQRVKVTTSSIHNAKTATGVRQNVEELQASSKIREIPASVTRNLEIVRKVDLPSTMYGMASLSQHAVVVGYGWFRKGADCCYVSGEMKPHLGSEVGRVYDIALLTDGRSVASHDYDTLLVYDKQGNQIRGMSYTCPDGNPCPRLWSDQHDNIYAVNGTSQIFIFHGNNTQPTRVVPTGDIKPEQICVTKTGVMITSTCYTTPSTVTVFDREGHVGTSITVSDRKEYLYAAVDSQDRVLIARVRNGSDTIGLTRYTLQGLTPTKEVTFNPLKLHKQCSYGCSYMVSLTPKMIAFADKSSLYFIKIPV